MIGLLVGPSAKYHPFAVPVGFLGGATLAAATGIPAFAGGLLLVAALPSALTHYMNELTLTRGQAGRTAAATVLLMGAWFTVGVALFAGTVSVCVRVCTHVCRSHPHTPSPAASGQIR